MSIGDCWRLPDGREAIETGRSVRLLRVIPILPDPPFMERPELVWREACTLLPSRYLHGELPERPPEPFPLADHPELVLDMVDVMQPIVHTGALACG